MRPSDDALYVEALKYIYSFADMERGIGFSSRSPREFTFERVRLMLQFLGNPHRDVRFVHVAGSKGKGSTSAMIASMAKAAGLRVGLYTQPHLHSFTERIMVNLKPIDRLAFARLVRQVRDAVDWLAERHPDLGPPTTFEFATVAALKHFRDADVDLAVIEVGLGGTWDATNVISPLVSVITSLEIEHSAILGDTIEDISNAKTGIIKPGVPVVTVPQAPEAMEIIRARSASAEAELTVAEAGTVAAADPLVGLHWVADRPAVECTVRSTVTNGLKVSFPLPGQHQLINAGAAVRAIEALAARGLGIDTDAIRAGLASCRWPCRTDVLRRSPLVIADGAHTSRSTAHLASALQTLFGVESAAVVFGALSDKQHVEILRTLKPIAGKVHACSSAHPRSASPLDIVSAAAEAGIPAELHDGTGEALRAALEESGDIGAVVATGSLFVAAEAREELGLAGYVDPVLIPKPALP
ncbi:MAG: bifunctional folylpolyglutamate synthase/dihydrofolate synthase [Chloroflexi bacterium]|nr:bifunctional folylpolyglutamate synthase/dihydrofolate synthase [Chloroflexota bacterium]